MVAHEAYRDLILWRMLHAIISSVVVQFFLVSGVILFNNLDLLHPLSWIQSTWSTVICLRMVWYFCILTLIILLQGFICSKNYLHPAHYAKSRFSKLCSMFTIRNLVISILYVTIGGILAWLHLSLNGGRYNRMTKECKLDAQNKTRCLVEGYYYLIISGFWTGFYFVMKTNILGTHRLNFCVVPQTKLSQLRRGIYVILPNAIINACWPSLYFLLIYYLLGNKLRGFILSMTSIAMEDEPLNLFQPQLVYHAWLHAVLFILSMNSMQLLFCAYLTEWVPFSIEQNDLAMMDALSSTEIPVIQHLAFLDLVTIAQKDAVRRKLLFCLSQPGGHPYNWNCVVQKTLATVKEFSTNVNSTTSSANKDQMQANGPTFAKTVIKSQDSEKPVYVYHMRNLASPSVPSPTKAINCEIPKQSIPGEQMFSHYLKIFKQSVLSYLLSKPLINYVFAEQMDSKVRHILLNGQPVIWAADAISLLVAISIKEDPYGIVQKDLPNVIETLLNAKESLDKLHKMNLLLRRPVSDDKDVRQMLTALRSAVRRSIYRIVCTFRDYINDLALEPYTLSQLQPYFNYRE